MEKIGNKPSETVKDENITVEGGREKEATPENQSKKIVFDKKNIESVDNRRKIMSYLKEEGESNLEQMVGLGLISEKNAKKELSSLQETIKKLDENYNRDHKDKDEETREHADKVFLYGINQIMENDIRMTRSCIDKDRDQNKTHLGEFREEIIRRYDQGEIDKNIKERRIRVIDKMVKDSAEKTKSDFEKKVYGAEASKLVENENKKYDEIAGEYKKAEADYAKKKAEFESKNGRGFTEDQIKELEDLEEKKNSLWNDQKKYGKLVVGSDEERLKKKIDEVAVREKEKAEARLKKLADVLEIPADRIDDGGYINSEITENETNKVDGKSEEDKAGAKNEDNKADSKNEKGEDKTDNTGEAEKTNLSINPAILIRVLYPKMAAVSSGNSISEDKEKEKNEEQERISALEEFYESLNQDSIGENNVKAVAVGKELYNSTKGEAEKNDQKILDQLHKQVELVKSLDEKDSNYDFEKGVLKGMRLLVNNERGRIREFSEMAAKFGDEAASAFMFNRLLYIENELLKQYDPELGERDWCAKTGNKFDPDKIKDKKPCISEETYNSAAYVIASYKKELFDSVRQREKLSSYDEAKNKIKSYRKTIEYKKLVQYERERADLIRAQRAADAEVAKADSIKVEDGTAKKAEAINDNKNVLSLSKKTSLLANDYIRGVFVKENATRWLNFMKGKNVYDVASKDLDAQTLEKRTEENEELRQAIDGLKLESLFKGSAREMKGKDRFFEASYIYSELDREFSDVKEQLEKSIHFDVSERERDKLKLQVNLLHNMMDSFTSYYSETFNEDKIPLRNNFLNNVKYNTANKARRLFRNLIRGRSLI